MKKIHRNSKKMALLDRSHMKEESIVWFDKKLSRYHRLWNGMKSVPSTKIIAFIEIDSHKVVSAIQSQVHWFDHLLF